LHDPKILFGLMQTQILLLIENPGKINFPGKSWKNW